MLLRFRRNRLRARREKPTPQKGIASNTRFADTGANPISVNGPHGKPLCYYNITFIKDFLVDILIVADLQGGPWAPFLIFF